MKTLWIIGGLLVALATGGAYGAYTLGDWYVSGTWRYKVTIALDTPEGLKTGSAVYELSNSDSKIKIIDLPEVGNPGILRGEAVVVDLGARGLLFSLVPDEHWFYSAIPVPGSAGASTLEGIRYYKNLKQAKAVLAPAQYPQMVMFKEITDPKSVTMAYGGVFDGEKQDHVPKDAMAELFGAGVTIKDVTIEMTEEPVTTGIEKQLGWLEGLHGSYLHGGTTSREAPLGLYAGNFKTGR